MPTNPAHPLLPLSRVATIILLLTAASCAQPPTTASVAIPPIRRNRRASGSIARGTLPRKTRLPLRPPQRRDRRCSGARGRLLPRCPARTLSDHGRQPGLEPQPLPRRCSRSRRADLCEDRPRSELERPGIYHRGGAKRGRTHCNRAQPILWRSRIERQSSGDMIVGAGFRVTERGPQRPERP